VSCEECGRKKQCFILKYDLVICVEGLDREAKFVITCGLQSESHREILALITIFLPCVSSLFTILFGDVIL
jgi:hypothetical protein